MSRESAELPEIGYRNRERDRKVAKRTKEAELMRFYYASTMKYNYGDVLEGQNNETSISLSDSPIPHQTIASERILPSSLRRESDIQDKTWNFEDDRRWFVYEVEVIGKIHYHSELEHVLAEKVKIIKFVGYGRPMLEKQLVKAKEHKGRGLEDSGVSFGSKTHGVERVREGKNKVEGHGRRHGDVMIKKQELKNKKEKNGL